MKIFRKIGLSLLILALLILFGAPLATEALLRQQIFKQLEQLKSQNIMIEQVDYQEQFGHSQLNFLFYGQPVKIENYYGFLEILSGYWLKSTGIFKNQHKALLNVYLGSQIEFQSIIPAFNWQGLDIPNTAIKFIRPAIWRPNYQLILGQNELQLTGVLPKKALSVQALHESVLIIQPNWAQKLGLYPILTLSYGGLLLPKNAEGNYQFQIKVENQKISLNKM